MTIIASLHVTLPVHADSLAWRGDGTGRYPDANPPVHWSTKSNILWQTEIGAGQSTPVTADRRIFVTAEPDRLVCLDRDTGAILWTKTNSYASLPADIKAPAKPPATATGCGYATPTPVTDGTHIFASFGTGIVAAYDFDGHRQWIRLLDRPLVTQYGRAGSPVLAAGKLLISIGGLVALNPASGKTLWEAPDAKPTYGTPAIGKIGDVDIAITSNGDCARVSDGKILASKLAHLEYVSPLAEAGIVHFVAATARAYKPDQMQFTKLWENEDLEGQFFASPVKHDGVLYTASNLGKLYALDAATGQLIFEQALPIGSQSGDPGKPAANVYPSLALVGNRLLVSNDAGETLVLIPSRKYQELTRNYLRGGSGASPVAAGNCLYLRTGTRLCCIGAN